MHIGIPEYIIHYPNVVVSYKGKDVHKLLVNRLFKPAQEKVWLGELTIAVDLGCKATNKQNKTIIQIPPPPPPHTHILTICIWETSTFENSEDLDEMQHNAAFHQGLHCL